MDLKHAEPKVVMKVSSRLWSGKTPCQLPWLKTEILNILTQYEMLLRVQYVGWMVAGSPLNVSEVKCELLSDYQFTAGLKAFIKIYGCMVT